MHSARLPGTLWLCLFAGLLLAPAARSIEERPTISITLASRGDVKQKPEGAEPASLAFGDVIRDSTEVRTGGDGFCSMAFVDDGSQLKLRPRTAVYLRAARDSETSLARTISLRLGELLTEAKRQQGATVVKTATAVASVKGTLFWTVVNGDGGTRILTLEGEVEVRSTLLDSVFQVPAGSSGLFAADGTVRIGELDPADVPVWQPEPRPEPDEGEPGRGEGERGGPGAGPAPPSPPGKPGGRDGETMGGPGEPPPGEPGGEGAGASRGWEFGPFQVQLNASVGAAVLDGTTYQAYSIRPDIGIGKLGIGLDLPLYFDSQGNLREEDWDDADDILTKFYYVRWARPDDPFYVRAGALDDVTLGYGLIMRRYTNALEWPQVRRIGGRIKLSYRNFTLQTMFNDFSELDEPGVIGGRLTYEANLKLPVVFGATVVHDGNQFLGAKDGDGDGVPDAVDQFPDRNDDDHISWLRGTIHDDDIIDQLIHSGDIPDINNRPPMIQEVDTADVTIWGVDVGVPVLRRETMSLWLYGQAAQIVDYGRGYTVPGAQFRWGPFRASAEYRIFEKEFTPDFFDMSYEVERVSIETGADETLYITKSSRLDRIPSAQGYYADAGITLFDLVDFYASYQYMNYGDNEADQDTVETFTVPNKSLYGRVAVDPTFIPKIGLLEGYYYQPHTDKLFDTGTDGTTVGYRVGFELTPSILLVADHATIYRHGTDIKVTTVETVFRF